MIKRGYKLVGTDAPKEKPDPTVVRGYVLFLCYVTVGAALLGLVLAVTR